MIDPTKQPFRVVYKGNPYIVKYRYEQSECIIKGKYSLRPIKGTTYAYIGDIADPIDGIYAVAYCCAKDQFNKKIGRTVANVRLLKLICNKEGKCLGCC